MLKFISLLALLCSQGSLVCRFAIYAQCGLNLFFFRQKKRLAGERKKCFLLASKDLWLQFQ